jgi:hypothetical protein
MPRTYRLGREMRVLVAGIAACFAAAGVASGLLAEPPEVALGLTVCFLAIAAFCVAGWVQARNYRVTIDEGWIEVVQWRLPRRLAIEQLAGRRRVQTKGGPVLILVPRDGNAKPLKISMLPSMDAAFDEWVARLRDLDAGGSSVTAAARNR